MTLDEIMRYVSHLSADELRHLREHIEQIERGVGTQLGPTPQERIRQMDEAVKTIREGMTQEQIDEMIEAMNAEYVEPFDEDAWKD